MAEAAAPTWEAVLEAYKSMGPKKRSGMSEQQQGAHVQATLSLASVPDGTAWVQAVAKKWKAIKGNLRNVTTKMRRRAGCWLFSPCSALSPTKLRTAVASAEPDPSDPDPGGGATTAPAPAPRKTAPAGKPPIWASAADPTRAPPSHCDTAELVAAFRLMQKMLPRWVGAPARPRPPPARRPPAARAH